MRMQVINLLAKGSLKHCTHQLKKTPEEHIDGIYESLTLAMQKGMAVNLYLEDWSSGMKDSPDYVFKMMDALVRVESSVSFCQIHWHTQPYGGGEVFRPDGEALSRHQLRIPCT